MTIRFKRTAIVIAFAAALPAASLAAHAATATTGSNSVSRSPAPPSLWQWESKRLYENAWSAVELIGTNVRGENGHLIGTVKDIVVDHSGSVTKVIAEVGGLLEIGDQHFGVPWPDVRIGPEMRWVQVPLREVENGTYSLYGHVREGEEVPIQPAAWRVNELIGDYASLEDVPRYGLITDVIFDHGGTARAVVVSRPAGLWGPHGSYAYPFHGYHAGRDAYPLPYHSGAVAKNVRSFEYVKLGELSRFSNLDHESQ